MRAPDIHAENAERRKISDLIPYVRNSRKHTPESTSALVRGIQEWGWTYPILIDEAGNVLSGHGRLLAAERLKMDEVPVIVARGWSDEKKRAYIIWDNKSAELSVFDPDVLRLELGTLLSDGFDLSLTGFSTADLSTIFATQEGLTDPDAVPDVPAEPISKIGDVWLCGDHRVMCGDSLDIAQVRVLLDGVTPELANCDAPYGISIVKEATDGGPKPFGSAKKRSGSKVQAYGNGGAPYGGWKDGDRQTRLPKRRGTVGAANIIAAGYYDAIIGDDTTDTAVAAYHLLVSLGVPAIALWGGNYFANHLPASRCWLVWDKETNGNFADAELAWTNQDKVVKLFKHQWSGLMKASERGQRRVHPTQKPVVLAEWVADSIAPKARTVLDLFLGSGSVLIAAQTRGLRCFGMELSPAYVDVSIARWSAFTGSEPVLAETNETWEAVKARRADVL